MISKCSTVVLSKSKFSDFDVLPEGVNLDEVFLAGYSFDEDGGTYNVKVQASKVDSSANKGINVIENLQSSGSEPGKYEWKYILDNKVCEFDTIDNTPYIEVKGFCACCADGDFNFKISDDTQIGTEVTFVLIDIPASVKNLKLFTENGTSKIVYTHEEDECWTAVFKVLKTSVDYFVFNVAE